MNEFLSSLTEKLKQFIEIFVVLILDFGLTVALWYFKSATDSLNGFEQMQQKDPSFKWIMSISAYGLYLVLVLFIIGDISKQGLKTFIQIRQQLRSISNENPNN